MEESMFGQTRTELHTHLMGMLTANEFLKLLAKYSNYLYWPINKTEDENSEYVNSALLINNQAAIRAISIPDNEIRPYEKGLKELYRNRGELMKFVVKKFAVVNGLDEDIAQYIIYNDYFNRGIKELIEQGVKYTEISFSDEDIIEHLKLDEKLKDKINYSFLLCTRRYSKVGPSVQEKIKRACQKGDAVGFDFMGFETPIDEEELRKTGRKSWYRKLESVLEVLRLFPNSVLRIHSGEAVGTEENSEKLFRIIDEIKRDRGYDDFPPPELRIGHGVHYVKTDYYYDFLVKNHAIVEINSTSNIKLSNIKSFSELPYIDYLKHGIPIALSTDGHGAYDTKVIFEDKIAYLKFLKSKIPEAYSLLTEWENNYLEKKVSR